MGSCDTFLGCRGEEKLGREASFRNSGEKELGRGKYEGLRSGG